MQVGSPRRGDAAGASGFGHARQIIDHGQDDPPLPLPARQPAPRRVHALEEYLRLLALGRLDVLVEGRGRPVVSRDIVPSPSLLVEPEPAPTPLPEVVLPSHPQDQALTRAKLRRASGRLREGARSHIPARCTGRRMADSRAAPAAREPWPPTRRSPRRLPQALTRPRHAAVSKTGPDGMRVRIAAIWW